MSRVDYIIRIGAISGAVVAAITLIATIIKYMRPLKKSIDTIGDIVSRSRDTNALLKLLSSDRLSMIANLVIQRGWHTLTEHQIMTEGLEKYRNLGGNSEIEIKVEMALRTELRADPFVEKAMEDEEERS